MSTTPALPSNSYYDELRTLLAAASNRAALYEAIVNAPFHEMRQSTHLDLGIVVLLLVNAQDQTIDRIALSDTEPAKGAVRMSEKPFSDIKIPLHHGKNIIARAITTGKPQGVSDWELLFVPALSGQAARYNQAGAGIEYSVVHPLSTPEHGAAGALIFSFFQPSSNITGEHTAFTQAYATLASEFLAKHGD